VAGGKLIPTEVRADIERTVAEALNLDDLRRAVETVHPAPGRIPADHDEIDLVVMWVWLNCGTRWPAGLREDDDGRACIDGYIVAAVQAHDLYRGADPAERPLKPHQRSRLQRWEAECRR
jgi:hypothetical protein